MINQAPTTVTAEGNTGIAGRFRDTVKALSPAYFAMVMATGIVSIATFQMGLPAVAVVLFYLNIAVYVTLIVLYSLRLLWFPRLVLGDLTDHLKGPGFFTSIAGSCVLGTQFALIDGSFRIATILLAAGIVLWLGLIYTVFTAFTIKEEKPSLSEGLSGAWLLAVVATQSIAVLGALLVPHMGIELAPVANFLALSMWLFGGMLYIWMISLIFYRYAFFKFSPADLTPPYWINMGAMAISTLAGARLIGNSAGDPLLGSLLPFLKGFTLFFWATGTWWIPMLLALGVWRHLYKRFPLRYNPLYWGAVFPLGMYTVCTLQMSKVLGIGFLEVVPRFMIYVAMLAWLAAFAGWTRSCFGSLRDIFTTRQRAGT